MRTLRLNENVSKLCPMSVFDIRNFELSGPVLRVLWIPHKHHSEYFLNFLTFPQILGGVLQTLRRQHSE
jgi:hypothetical protein